MLAEPCCQEDICNKPHRQHVISRVEGAAIAMMELIGTTPQGLRSYAVVGRAHYYFIPKILFDTGCTEQRSKPCSGTGDARRHRNMTFLHTYYNTLCQPTPTNIFRICT